MAEHIRAFAAEEARIRWEGDGAAGQPLPYFREMRVVGTTDLTPRMRRIRLAGRDLARFAVGGPHVRLLFPTRSGRHPSWPVTGEDGRPVWPAGAERLDARAYTIRRIDPDAGLVDIDFVLHHGGSSPGARFAARARPGDVVGMTGPGGGGAPLADWVLLAGDETALPAIARILETLPPGCRATVRVEVADRSEEQPLSSAAQTDIQWLHRGARRGLEDAVRAVEWPVSGTRFAWVGCEHAAFTRIRRFLREEKQLGRDEHLVVAYWRRGGDQGQDIGS